MAKLTQNDFATPFLAGLLAWLVPGAGHIYMGRKLRGLIICAAINGLFWGGVAIGGVFTVEPARERWWYYAQVCTGASGLAGWYRQHREQQWLLDKHKASLSAGQSASLSYKEYTDLQAREGLALVHPADIVARAYSGIAGMLNLLCIFDAVMLALMGKLGEPPPEAPQPAPTPAGRKPA